MKKFNRQDLMFRYVKRLLSEMSKEDLEQFFADVQFEALKATPDDELLEIILGDFPDLDEFVRDDVPVIKLSQAN